MAIKILNLNCRGLRTEVKRLRLINFLLHFKPDILLLQDTHITEELEGIVKAEFSGYNLSFSNGTNDSRGVLTATKNEHKCIYKNDGRILTVEIEFQSTKVNFTNIYAQKKNCAK